MTDFEMHGWREAVKNVVALFGYDGEVTVEKGQEPGTYCFKHSAFDHPFIGYYPQPHELFTVITVDHSFRDPGEKEDRKYKEAFVFDAANQNPLFYSIFKEPVFQRVMISAFYRHAPGAILCENRDSREHYMHEPLEELLFQSELFNLDEVRRGLK